MSRWPLVAPRDITTHLTLVRDGYLLVPNGSGGFTARKDRHGAMIAKRIREANEPAEREAEEPAKAVERRRPATSRKEERPPEIIEAVNRIRGGDAYPDVADDLGMSPADVAKLVLADTKLRGEPVKPYAQYTDGFMRAAVDAAFERAKGENFLDVVHSWGLQGMTVRRWKKALGAED
jgi:hypothetical protein